MHVLTRKSLAKFTISLIGLIVLWAGCTNPFNSINQANVPQEEYNIPEDIIETEDYIIVQGDIYIPKSNPGYEQLVNSLVGKKVFGGKGNYWPINNVLLKWSDAQKTDLTFSFKSDMKMKTFTDAQVKSAVRAALNQWQSVCDISFREVSSNGLITFEVAPINAYGYCTPVYWTNSYDYAAAAIVIDDDNLPTLTRVQDTTLHEIGHAIGLGHEHDRIEAGGDGTGIPFSTCDRNSIMDYARPRNAQLTANDIATIRNIYGPQFTRTYASMNGIIGFNMKDTRDKLVSLDFNNDNHDDIICYRPGAGAVFVGRSNGNGTFTNVYASTNGIIGYNMKDNRDQLKVLDFNNDGYDDIICYRPGAGPVFLGRSNGNGTFTNVYASSNGIVGYNMKDNRDQLKVLDFNNDGYDDIICYRPGAGPVFVGRSNGNGTFTNVYASSNGIVGYNMKDNRDQLKVLDFNNDGYDDIICYRPGAGPVFVGRSNGNGTFTNVYASADGIIGYNMKDNRDQLLVLDINNDNRDDILCYRPGAGPVFIGRSNGNGTFTNVYASANGIIGYDMKSDADQIKVLDYNGDGRDDILCYRPGTGYVFLGYFYGNGLVKSVKTGFGIIGYDMKSSSDQIEVLDFNGDGHYDIICYRPGSGPVFAAYGL